MEEVGLYQYPLMIGPCRNTDFCGGCQGTGNASGLELYEKNSPIRPR